MSFGSPPAVQYIEGRASADRPFVPIVGTLAAAIDQVPPRQFLSDATRLANGLQRAQRLFDLDAVPVVPDPALIAEAFGADVAWDDDRDRFVTAGYVDSVDSLPDPNTIPEGGRVPTVVDAAERVATSTGDDVAVLGVLPGPLTTAAGVFEDPGRHEWERPVRTATGDVARALGRAGVDAFLVMEWPESVENEGRDGSVVDSAVETLDVVDNIGEFFGTPVTVAPAGYPPAAVEAVVDQTSVDAVFLDTDHPERSAVDAEDVRVGGGLTTALLEADDDDVERTVRERVAGFPSGVFLASGVPIPPDVHPRKVQAAQRALDEAVQ